MIFTIKKPTSFIIIIKFKSSTYSHRKLQTLWLRFLTEIQVQTKEISSELFENIEIKAAIKQLEVSAFNDDEIEAYERYRDVLRKNHFEFEYATEFIEYIEESEKYTAEKISLLIHKSARVFVTKSLNGC